MKSKEELLTLAEDIKKTLPSFTTIPVEKKEGDVTVKSNFIGVIKILDGKFKDFTIGLADISFGDDNNIQVEYTCVDSNGDMVESNKKDIDTIVGNIINYFIICKCLESNYNEALVK